MTLIAILKPSNADLSRTKSNGDDIKATTRNIKPYWRDTIKNGTVTRAGRTLL